MTVLVSIVGGIVLTAVVLATAPWWATAVGRLVEWWLDWCIGQMDRIEERRKKRVAEVSAMDTSEGANE